MSTYQIIKLKFELILKSFNYKETIIDQEIDTIGSVFSIFVFEKKRFLLEWDQEEEFFFIQRWDGKQWVELNNIVLRADEDNFEKSILKLENELKTHITTG